MLTTGEEGKPLTLYLDQYRVVLPKMYEDLAIFLKNQSVGGAVDKTELRRALAGIHQQLAAERKAGAAADDLYEDDDLTPEERTEKERQ